MSAGARLKARLRQGVLVAPGAYDALSARIAMQAGSEAVYMTGFGVSGSLLGTPDIGLVSATEMSARLDAMAAACAPVPLIADGDNGHGGPLNVERLVLAYERGGAACIQLEDQALPKRCGHMDGKHVIGVADAVAKIRAAVSTRSSSNFLVMARTDARAVHGLDDACRRADAYASAGADMLFVEAPQNEAELAFIGARFKGIPLVANMVEDGKTPSLSAVRLEQMGFSLVIYPVSALLVVAQTLRDTFTALAAGNGLPPDTRRLSFSGYNELVGLPDYLSRARQFDSD